MQFIHGNFKEENVFLLFLLFFGLKCAAFNVCGYSNKTIMIFSTDHLNERLGARNAQYEKLMTTLYVKQLQNCSW